jgi:DNA-binding NtrC family response regulator
MASRGGNVGAKQTILVVDSEVIVRHSISDYLRECGYDVIEAATTDEAVTVLGDASIVVDAVMCEVAASGSRTGFELSVWARRERPSLAVILSGSIPAAASAAAELCDDGPHVARPYDPQAVVDYIKRLLAQRDRSGG